MRTMSRLRRGYSKRDSCVSYERVSCRLLTIPMPLQCCRRFPRTGVWAKSRQITQNRHFSVVVGTACASFAGARLLSGGHPKSRSRQHVKRTELALTSSKSTLLGVQE
jgi:hypothetical protein